MPRPCRCGGGMLGPHLLSPALVDSRSRWPVDPSAESTDVSVAQKPPLTLRLCAIGCGMPLMS